MAASARILLYAAVFAMVIGIVYQAAVIRAHFVDHAKVYQERDKFLHGVPQEVRGYAFLASLVHESERIVAQGLYLPTLTRWIEQSYFYKAITLDSWYSRLSMTVMILFLMYLTFQYFVNTRYIETMSDKMAERNAIFQGRGKRGKIIADPQEALLRTLSSRAAKKQQEQAFADVVDSGQGTIDPAALAAMALTAAAASAPDQQKLLVGPPAIATQG
jgi:hypothetical protein